MPPTTPKSRTRRGRASASPAPVPAPSPATGDVVPGRLTKSQWLTMVTGEEGEEAVAEILDELMSRVMEKCYSVYLYRQLIPFTVSRARDTLVRVLEWQFLMQDRGEGQDGAPLWAEDAEPQPGVTDSWAEGSVPVYSSSPAPPTSTAQAGPHVPKPLQRLTAPPVVILIKNRGGGQKNQVPGTADPQIRHHPPHRGGGKGGGSGSPHLKPRYPPPEAGLPTLRTPSGHSPLLGGSLGCTPRPDERDPTAGVWKGAPLPRPPGAPATQRPNPARLPRRYFCPGFEVLKPSPVPLPSRKKGGHDAQAPMPYEGLSKWGAPGGAVCVFSTRNIQDGGLPQGFTPLSASLLLDAMKLSPGVSIRGRAKPPRERPSQPERRADLVPVRGTLPVPPLRRDLPILGPPLQAVPFLSAGEVAGPV
ncbi:hypothetical protein ANANG_G00195890 [Anguilla anguilla]|uniref:Uncharacterized protein n=1 Tax=Anguilla anguilla TaxID=7936 RepID=A0A9D3M8X0_ANGAN|nr:hypothetical protein ANANG_G00195890 [Anguilla anguilla]